MRRALSAAAVLALGMGLPSTAWAQPCPYGCPWGGPGIGPSDDGFAGPGPGAGPGMMFRCILDSRDLGLTNDQRRDIEKVLDQGREEGRRFREEARDLKDQFLKTFADPKVTADQIRDMARAMRKHREDLADHRLEVLLKVRAILTPEQLKKVPDVMDGCRPAPRHRHRGGR